MERVLRLPCNEKWYNGIKDGIIKYDYRDIKPYWTKRLEDKEYDIIEFYHRFKKELTPIKYKFENILKTKLPYTHKEYYIIEFGNRIE